MSGLYLVFYILVILTSICVQKTISQDLDNLDDNEGWICNFFINLFLIKLALCHEINVEL